jgi:hypothetical protein
MRGTVITATALAFGALILAGAQPAQATPAAAALGYGKTDAGVVEQVARKYRYSRKWRGGPYYAYRPYRYWGGPYAYYGPRYYGYDYPYYYRRGPGVSLWFGF